MNLDTSNNSSAVSKDKSSWLNGLIALAVLSLLLFVGRAFSTIATAESGYYVKPVYFVPSDGTIPPQYEEKMQTAILMVQEYYANEMERNGFGKRPFNLEMNEFGKPQVHLVRGENTTDYYLTPGTHPIKSIAKIQPELNKIFDRDRSLLWVMTPWGPWTGERYPEPTIHGGAAYTGDFLNDLGITREEELAILCDTTLVNDDETTRPKGRNAGIRLGGAAHEIGHAFGARHANNPDDLMSAHFNFGAYFVSCPIEGQKDPPRLLTGSALLMNNSVFFRDPAAVYSDTNTPVINVELPKNLAPESSFIPLKLTVSDLDSGLSLLNIRFNNTHLAVHVEDLRGRGNPISFTYNLGLTDSLKTTVSHTVYFDLFDEVSNRMMSSVDFRSDNTEACDRCSSLVSPFTFITRDSNTLLVVAVNAEDSAGNFSDKQVISLTYGGKSLTRINSVEPRLDNRVELWYLTAPPQSTNDLAVTWRGNVDAGLASVIFLSGVKQSGPEAQVTVKSDIAKSVSASVNVPTPQSWVVDAFHHPGGSSIYNNAGSSQEVQYNIPNFGDFWTGGSKKFVESAGQTTMSWTTDTQNRLGLLVAVFAPAF